MPRAWLMPWSVKAQELLRQQYAGVGAAAHAALESLRPRILFNREITGKLAQAFMYGAKVVAIDGNFDAALRLVREIGETEPIAIVNSINPFRLEGQKTAAFEIIEVLGDAPDIHVLPVGNAGNITAYWTGYREYHDARNCTRLPAMIGFQAAGAAPLVSGAPIESPQTKSSQSSGVPTCSSSRAGSVLNAQASPT